MIHSLQYLLHHLETEKPQWASSHRELTRLVAFNEEKEGVRVALIDF